MQSIKVKKAKIVINKDKKNNLSTQTILSGIDGMKGTLTISGYSIQELASNATFEEAVYILWNQKQPTKDELVKFSFKLTTYRELSPLTENLIRTLVSQNVLAMEVLQVAISTLLVHIKDKMDFHMLKLLVIAKFPTIIAYYVRIKSGKEIIKPDKKLGHVENFLYMLNRNAPSKKYVKALETYLITVLDHGLNASTFTSRCIISSNSDIVSTVIGALGSLKGSIHGGAPGPVLEMVLAVKDQHNIEQHLRNILEKGKRLMGFGHRVYKTRDPRADVLKEAGKYFYEDNKIDVRELFTKVEEIALKLLEEYKPGRQLYTNVEFYTAYLLYGLGFENELFSPIFAMSRVAGWIAHAEEQRKENSLIRPKAMYIGQYGKKWKQLA
ncbi:MAG: citrate/2-methylcitrate synthase [Candidatus Hodarchaeales archaeon]|jgi:citrate synthase